MKKILLWIRRLGPYLHQVIFFITYEWAIKLESYITQGWKDLLRTNTKDYWTICKLWGKYCCEYDQWCLISNTFVAILMKRSAEFLKKDLRDQLKPNLKNAFMPSFIIFSIKKKKKLIVRPFGQFPDTYTLMSGWPSFKYLGLLWPFRRLKIHQNIDNLVIK